MLNKELQYKSATQQQHSKDLALGSKSAFLPPSPKGELAAAQLNFTP